MYPPPLLYSYRKVVVIVDQNGGENSDFGSGFVQYLEERRRQHGRAVTNEQLDMLYHTLVVLRSRRPLDRVMAVRGVVVVVVNVAF